jgi:hypothetical protein
MKITAPKTWCFLSGGLVPTSLAQAQIAILLHKNQKALPKLGVLLRCTLGLGSYRLKLKLKSFWLLPTCL